MRKKTMGERSDEGKRGGAGPEDPLLDEVRELRRSLWERFGNDPGRVYAHLRELEQANADRLVRAVTEERPPTSE